MSFATNLKKARKSKGLTQRQLTAEANLPKGTISHYENSQRVPKIINLKKIANVLEVSIDALAKD